MVDRAQPGAIKSALRNDELAQILGQLTGGYDDGWVVDPADPTPAARRRSDIDESAFDGFDLSGVSGSSLSVGVGPGEAFAAGWLAIDTTTTVSLSASTTATIVAAMDVDAVYDSDTDADRDAADRVVVDTAANVPSDHPRVELWTVETDGSGVVDTTDLRQPFGPAAMLNELVADVIDANTVSADVVNSEDFTTASSGDVVSVGTPPDIQTEAKSNIDAAEWGGSNGSGGQILGTDGIDTAWVDKPETEKADVDNAAHFSGSASVSSNTWFKLMDETDRDVLFMTIIGQAEFIDSVRIGWSDGTKTTYGSQGSGTIPVISTDYPIFTTGRINGIDFVEVYNSSIGSQSVQYSIVAN